MRQTLSCQIAESSQVASARREAGAFGTGIGASQDTIDAVTLVVTEMATNILKHAGSGEILVQQALGGRNEPRGVEVFALDKGPGMANVQECLCDGFSTTKTSGTGLGAIARLSERFDAYSRPGQGTTIFAVVRSGGGGGSGEDASGQDCNATHRYFNAVSVPKRGETECGDAYCLREERDSTSLLMVDGLGHGHDAAAVARESVRRFCEEPVRGSTQTMEFLHGALRPTRGGAGAVALIRHGAGTLAYCGVGNIAATIFGSEGDKQLVSMNGTIGHEARRFTEFSYPWTEGSILVMASDGLATRWDMRQYPGLVTRNPALIAAVLYRDFSRGRDDATVAVLREVKR